jgi:lauroyl/myristoyl acyltransferase
MRPYGGLPHACASTADAGTWKNVRLHPTLVRHLGGDDYALVRIGGRIPVKTGSSGVEALRLLRRSGSVSDVSGELARQLHSPVDLSGFLNCLSRAGIVHTADETVVDGRRSSWTAALKSYWRFWVDWESRLSTLVARRMPPAMAIPVLARLRLRCVRRDRRFRNHLSPSQRSSASAQPRSTIPHGSHLTHMATQDALARVMYQARPKALHSWLQRKVAVVGLPGVDQAGNCGRGRIFCALHLGPFPLIPITLLARGYSLHGIHFGAQVSGPPVERVFDSHVAACGWAPVVIHRRADTAAIRALIRALRNGQNLMVLPDFVEPKGPAGEPGSHRRPTDASLCDRPTNPLEMLLGAASTWVGWLARQGNAVIIPSRCCVRSDGGFQVEFGSPIEPIRTTGGDKKADDLASAAAVLEALAPDLTVSPEQWAFLLVSQHPASTYEGHGTR